MKQKQETKNSSEVRNSHENEIPDEIPECDHDKTAVRDLTLTI